MRHFSVEKMLRNGVSISKYGLIVRNKRRREPTPFNSSAIEITIHRQDLKKFGKDIGRSKTASLIFLDERLEHLHLPELNRERFINFGKARALDRAGPVTVGIDLGYIKAILFHAAALL